jgi:retinol dehydrogenase-12
MWLFINEPRRVRYKMGIKDAVGILRSQFAHLPYPTKKFTGQTIIVTSSNVGLGLEAARHFVRLDAAKVIIAVR